jgi:hypothetical protein
VTGKLDVSEGRQLLEIRDAALATDLACDYRESALTQWLYDNREALIRATEERDALLRVVEAAQPIVKWTAGNCGDGVCDALDHWDLAVAELDALRSGKTEP